MRRVNIMRIELIKTCPFCGGDHSVEVGLIDAINYEMGNGYAQELFPYLSATEREQIISGICPKCQVNVFGE